LAVCSHTLRLSNHYDFLPGRRLDAAVGLARSPREAANLGKLYRSANQKWLAALRIDRFDRKYLRLERLLERQNIPAITVRPAGAAAMPISK